jgi:hypothetical protein
MLVVRRQEGGCRVVPVTDADQVALRLRIAVPAWTQIVHHRVGHIRRRYCLPAQSASFQTPLPSGSRYSTTKTWGTSVWFSGATWWRGIRKHSPETPKKRRKTPGSPQRRKVVRALNHAYQRASNRRNDFAHQESRKLDIHDMQGNGNKTINRGIADVAWGRFVQYSTYKYL